MQHAGQVADMNRLLQKEHELLQAMLCNDCGDAALHGFCESAEDLLAEKLALIDSLAAHIHEFKVSRGWASNDGQ